jgi:ABC-2 type transport system permease protein
VSAYLAAFRSGARRVAGAPAELGVRVLFYVVVMVVMASLWRVATVVDGGRVAGYSYTAVLWYIAMSECAVIATKPRMIEQIGSDVGGGSVAVEMLRPVSVVGFRIAWELGEALARCAWAATVGTVFAWVVAGAPPNAPACALAIAAMVLAVACNIVAQHAFAGAAFWLSDAKAMWFIYQKLVFLAGGMLLPLEIFPGWLRSTARLLPFWTMAYAPARLVSGHVEPDLIAGQAVWLCALVAIAVAVFAAGERRVQVGGG